MKVLDLFAGLKGWSQPWADRGHQTFSIDYDTRFDVDAHLDIMDVEKVIDALPWAPDVILASPPCEAFSVMTIGRNWTTDHQPKTDKARTAMDLVYATRELIDILQPRFFIIENPRAKLRKLPILADFERRTVTYCQVGEPYMKPTDLWGGFPPSLVLPPVCKPKAPCHASAPRGSKTGIQGPNEARWTHPVLMAQSNNGHREDERERAAAGRELMLASLPPEAKAWLDSLPPRKGTKFRGGMIEEMARFPSWSPERQLLSAMRAKIPTRLSLLVCEAAERDILEVAT